METPITVLYLFIISNLIAGFLFFQYGIDDTALLFPSAPGVPVLMLSAGPLLQSVLLLMCRTYLKEIPAGERCFPRLGIGTPETGRISYLWEKYSAFAVLVLPMIAFIWAWHRFVTRGSAWHTETEMATGKMDLVSPLLFFGRWHDHQYGDLAAADGVSFVPFWQPLVLMGGASLLVCILTIALGATAFHRAPIRKRVALRQG